MILRHALWCQGFRYRVNEKKLPGKPDIVLPGYRTVIFVHGCFWHGHKGCRYYTVPKTNTEFWQEKVASNQKRDQEVWRQLEAKEWHVIIVWECQLKKSDMEDTIRRIKKEIRQNGENYRKSEDARRCARETYIRERHAMKVRETKLMAEIKRI